MVHQRTELTNALRAHLYEYGYIAPQGSPGIKQIHDILDQERDDLPKLVRDLCRDMLQQIAEKTARIQAMLVQLKELATETETAKRLQTMPGVGPITALAIEAFAPPMETFRSGRDFAAWLGLVPRQHSSGGKQRLGRASKAGQVDIRKLLIIGAMSRLSWLGRKSIGERTWLGRILVRKPRLLVAVALANKMARAIWAMLTKKENYRDPALAASA
ncbi:transposase [Bradyrhizobium diazoefficiens]